MDIRATATMADMTEDGETCECGDEEEAKRRLSFLMLTAWVLCHTLSTLHNTAQELSCSYFSHGAAYVVKKSSTESKIQ